MVVVGDKGDALQITFGLRFLLRLANWFVFFITWLFPGKHLHDGARR